MQIVIDIPESIYETIKEVEVGNAVYKAIKNGTPLKGHGRLIDKDALIGKIHGVKSITAVLDAKTIIEADTESGKVRDRMIDIRFYIPKNESIPTDLRLYVGENYVEYERTANGFLFKTLIDDEDEAMKVVQQIVSKMESEHDESEHGVSWRTISLAVVTQEERYKIGTWVEWKYRVRDSY